MFTGIIEEIGTISKLQKKKGGLIISVTAQKSTKELKINDSIAINGVCQTVISKSGNSFDVEAVEETLKKTTFALLEKGSKVNLEMPMKLSARLGGHLVLGHVDCMGTISKIDQRDNSWMFSIKVPNEFTKYVVPVGSICVDGVSLTVAEMTKTIVKVSIIPHTMKKTIFENYRINCNVNLEFDIIGKYIEGLLSNRSVSKSTLTINKLSDLGY